MADLTLKDIAVRLFKANAIKFGSFVTQSGKVTPFYVDLRVVVSYPRLMKDLSVLLSEKVQQQLKNEGRTVVCGVPFAAVPIASLVSARTEIPLILKRKEAKSYGTMELVEGVWSKGDTCILIDDVIMFGHSISDTVDDLVKLGFRCTDVVVICDRQQGAAEELLHKKGVNVHALFTIYEIMDYLLEDGYLTKENSGLVKDYLKKNRVSQLFPSNGVIE